ncbi:uncharacterized protein C8R40DRAFT_1073135 [Lentinula edodes]|uniref:uncharacterized protein n=1 Tax=Lentinula edodes TaxID=5353 RepID=UPI001E8CF205|nr:uncharacterized protein C8R40DRAFT_1073135 [Lentinula edodes]KAH7870615.1 hypothetical protein C8R40DRAFT_1073135 [Lentinula edodes]
MDDILFQIESWLLSNYAEAAVITLCVADHIETWPREFSSIWKRKLTGISVLFLVNRYMLLLNLIIQAISAFPGNGTDKQCQALNTIFSIFAILSIVAANASAFIISRFALDVVSTVLEVGVSTIGSPFQNLSRCGLGINNLDQYIELAIPLLALGYDIFIFILTAIKTVQHSLEMQRLNQSSITQIIIRDGTLYFLLMLVVAIILAIFSVVSLKSGNTNNFENFVAPFFDILPNLLISRLMLNLHTYSEPGNSTISQGQQTHVSSLNFASNQMLGNIGAPLDGESFNEEEEEERLVIVQPPEHKEGF